MGIIGYNQGCGSNPGCFGPREGYYTFFGSRFTDLLPHVIVAIFFAIALAIILFALKNNKKIKLSNMNIYLISIVLAVVLFILFAIFFRIIVLY